MGRFILITGGTYSLVQVDGVFTGNSVLYSHFVDECGS